MEFGQCPFHTTSVDQWPSMFVELGGAWWGLVELRTQDLVGLSETRWNLVGLGGAQWSSALSRTWWGSVGLGGTRWDSVGLSRMQWNSVGLGGTQQNAVGLNGIQWNSGLSGAQYNAVEFNGTQLNSVEQWSSMGFGGTW